ncbi:MAG: methylenetetrahydrofolate reductase [Nanoarchaeota archaeon]
MDITPFTLSLEIVPPRNGVDHEAVLSKLEPLKGKIDFVSVTKGAGGSLRGGSLPMAFYAGQRLGCPVVAHVVCREKTRYELENDLIDYHCFGIKDILALRGDPPAGSPEEWKGDYAYAYLLIEQIKSMNQGHYLPREIEHGQRNGSKTDFSILAAGHPEDPILTEIEHVKKKAEAGAELIITQMVFSFENYRSYVESLREAGITLPVIAGLRPLISLEQAESAERFFKIPVGDVLKDGLRHQGKEFGISYSVDFIKKLKAYGAPGAHLFVLNDAEIVLEILARL